jgi:hypothetical protein
MNPNERLIQQHWLYQWIDEEGIKTPGNYLRAIRKRGAFDRLRELSDSAFTNPPSSKGDARTSVLAGRQLDLSGTFSCSHFECMTPIVDNVFSRVWHYFDSVIIDEVPLDRTLYSGDDVDDLQQMVKLFLYLRNIGAEKYLKFTQKVAGLCSEHFREYAKEQRLGLDVLFDEVFEREVVQRLTSEGVIRIYPGDGSWRYEIRHSSIGTLIGGMDHSDIEHQPSKAEAARSAFGQYSTGLISDVSASRALGLPLLEVAENSWMPRSLHGDTLNESAVALNLRLPVLTNVPVKEVLRYRDDYSASFELFRAALRDAIREQIKRSGSDSPEAIADAVVAECVRPKLAEIEVQLSGVRKTLARKISANIAVAGAAVSVGVIESVPLVVGVTATAVAASIAQIIGKRADDKQKAEESGWYFLWKARTSHRG